jgi:hypothetical protein
MKRRFSKGQLIMLILIGGSLDVFLTWRYLNGFGVVSTALFWIIFLAIVAYAKNSN